MNVEPVPASTILMLRNGKDNTSPLEVFMVERNHKIDFATGALVFPGGKVDPGDSSTSVIERIDGVIENEYKASLIAAAIREAFEECGILLARPTGEKKIVSGDRLSTLAHYRNALNKNEISLENFLLEEDLRLAGDKLTPFAHWITPTMMPKRFDTYFFLAEAPQDHIPKHDGYESTDSTWLTPQNAIEAAEAKTRTIIFPTLLNLQKLSQFSTTEKAIQITSSESIVTVLPTTEKRDDGNFICIPIEAGYGISESKID